MSSQNETAKAIAKIILICGHAEGFAENMLHNATNRQAPDLATAWSAFSGLLDPQTIDAADWGERTKRPASKHSRGVFDITEFVSKEPASPPSPMQYVVHQLTDAKAHAHSTPEGHQPPVLPAPLLLQWAGHGRERAAVKRKRDPDDDDDSTYGGGQDENDDDGNSDSD